MPVGVVIDAAAVLLGGLAGARLGGHLKEETKADLTMVFGLCAMGMGIGSIVLVRNMPSVVLALVLGTLFGLSIRFSERIRSVVQRVVRGENADEFVTIIVLFCASGTGVYGAICEGMSGDSSILLTKAVLDFFTAAIFASRLKSGVSLIAVPQFAINLALFLLAGRIAPLCSEVMIADFKACGGLVLLAIGFRIARVKMFPAAEMVWSMLLVMPLSWLWTALVVPFL